LKNEQGFYWIEAIIALFSTSLLLLTALNIYGAISYQLGRTVHDWEQLWEMKKWTLAWEQGTVQEGYYKDHDYEVVIQERAVSPTLKEGEIIFRWEDFNLPKEKKLYAYKVDRP